MRKLPIPSVLDLIDYLKEMDDLFSPDAFITTEQFVTMVIKSYKGEITPSSSNWSSEYINYALYKGLIEDYDIANQREPIKRRSVARILHEVLLLELKEKDEDDWSAAERLKDLYDCHTCVMHIAQVYVKGIISVNDNNIFNVLGCITGEEAASFVINMLHKEQRVPQRKEGKIKVKELLPDEIWEYMKKQSKAKLIDVRPAEDYKEGHLERSISIPLNQILNNPHSVCNDRDDPIILYCQKGAKSSIAANILIGAGYSRIYTIPGLDQFFYEDKLVT